MSDCIFCKIVSGEMPSQKIYEDDQVYAFLDIQPVSSGHTLVVPKNHVESYLETSDEDLAALAKAVKKFAPAILKAVGSTACNISVNNGRAAGQVVFHTHIHIIPRFPTDNLQLWSKMDEHQDFEEIASRIKQSIKN